ncbi:MAG: lysine--tRNA ligase [Planctomycetota bacterium]|nr:MAG: lysine--tRNA ligase [Planctomycetota bacterium]
MDVPPERRAKLEALREAGCDPFPPGSGLLDQRLPLSQALAEHDPDAEPRAAFGVAGRVMALRDHGNSLFLDVRDATGRLQLYLRKKDLGEEAFKLLKQNLDLGDFVAAHGELGRTRLGEATLFVSAAELLSKSLAVPPSEWYGLSDVETRYRQRYVDLVANPQSFARFAERSRLLSALRRALEERGFMEVETPMLHGIAGGAAARPFTTHHNTLDMDLFLRIAPELHLKRLLVGGYERVFEIGRNFRNEGLSPRHNPEFTMLEAYWAYARMDDWVDATEAILAELVATRPQPPEPEAGEDAGDDASAAAGDGAASGDMPENATDTPPAKPWNPETLQWGGHELSFARPFARATYAELLQEHAGANVHDVESVTSAARAAGLATEGLGQAKLIDELFGELVEPKLVQPTFVTDFPISMSPLAKARPEQPEVAERFELYIAGMEVANAFSELNDPDEQLRRFEEQVASRDPELPGEVDHDYVQALRCGMPPAAGIGIGVDRLTMLLTGAETIRDVILFPLLRRRAPSSAEAAQNESAPTDAAPAASGSGEGPAADATSSGRSE